MLASCMPAFNPVTNFVLVRHGLKSASSNKRVWGQRTLSVCSCFGTLHKGCERSDHVNVFIAPRTNCKICGAVSNEELTQPRLGARGAQITTPLTMSGGDNTNVAHILIWGAARSLSSQFPGPLNSSGVDHSHGSANNAQ